VDYLKHIDDFLELGKDSNPASHVLLATHNPFAVAELEKEQVQILRRDDDTLKISAGPPDLHPRGMGYAGVVTSDMFGLSAAIDTHTRELLERKRKLALKTEALTNDENIELAEINDELLSYGFRFEVRDPTYSKYLKARQDEINSSLNNEENTKNVTFDRERAKRLIRLALDEEDVEK